jgi:hypothetical protein
MVREEDTVLLLQVSAKRVTAGRRKNVRMKVDSNSFPSFRLISIQWAGKHFI